MLRRAILAALPSASVESSVGRTSSFEVLVDGKLAYSKLAKGTFPDYATLAKEVSTFAAGGAVAWA